MLRLIILLMATCADAPGKDAPASDVEKAQGSWIVHKQDWNPLLAPVKADLIQMVQLEIKGDTCLMTTRKSSKAPEERKKLRLSLDSTQKPRHMDFASNGKTSRIKAIYRFDTDGSLTIAMGIGDDYRPMGFDPADEPIFTLVLKKKP